MATVSDRTQRRTAKVRRKIRRAAGNRARLSVFRSSKHIYAQLIDDANGQTVVSASSLEKEMRGSFKTGANVEAAKAVVTFTTVASRRWPMRRARADSISERRRREERK